MVRIKQFGDGTGEPRPRTHQYFAVGPVLAGQADPHPLVVPVSLARLPTRLSRLVSWKTMGSSLQTLSHRDGGRSHLLLVSHCQLFFDSGFHSLFRLNVRVIFTPLNKQTLNKKRWFVVIWSISQQLLCYLYTKKNNTIVTFSATTTTLDFWGWYLSICMITIYWLMFHFLH